MTNKLILLEVQQDLADYQELDSIRDSLNTDINDAVNKSKAGGDLFMFEYNSTTPILDGKSFYHIKHYGTPSQRKRVWDMYHEKEDQIRKEERNHLIKVVDSIRKIENKYNFLLKDIYIDYIDGSSFDDFLKVIVRVLELQSPKLRDLK